MGGVAPMTEIAAELERVAEVCAAMRYASTDTGIEAGLLEPLTGLLGADNAVFRVFSAETGDRKPARVVTVGIAPAVNESYLSRYYALDPGWPWHEDRAPRGDFDRYRREFLRPNRLLEHVGFRISSAADGAWLFDLHRSGGRAFGAVERARARLVAQYLQAKGGGPHWQLAPAAPGAQRPLSAREAEVAEVVALGLGNKQVAAHLGLSVRTVENHLRAVFAKLGVSSRTALVARLRGRQGPR
jgi:DNA-binding CsgD family transcriptional regulator